MHRVVPRRRAVKWGFNHNQATASDRCVSFYSLLSRFFLHDYLYLPAFLCYLISLFFFIKARRMQAAYIDNPPPRYIDQARAFGQHFGGHVRSYFGGMLPIMTWLPHYNVNWLISDLICAITVGTVVVPQSMAYGMCIVKGGGGGLVIGVGTMHVTFCLTGFS